MWFYVVSSYCLVSLSFSGLVFEISEFWYSDAPLGPFFLYFISFQPLYLWKVSLLTRFAIQTPAQRVFNLVWIRELIPLLGNLYLTQQQISLIIKYINPINIKRIEWNIFSYNHTGCGRSNYRLYVRQIIELPNSKGFPLTTMGKKC